MAIIYFVFAFIVIVTHITALPAAIVAIVKSAFTGSALAGGAAGTMVVAMQKGIAVSYTHLPRCWIWKNL